MDTTPATSQTPVSDGGLAAFEAEARRDGYDEVLVREWAAGQVVGTHSHPFALRVKVVRGGLELTCRGAARPFSAGDRFELDHDEPHAEHYGPQGATFWVARRHGTPSAG